MKTPSHRAPLLDLHVHSTQSADGASSIVEFAQRADDLGLTDVAFCEHVDFDPRDTDFGYLDVERYANAFGAACPPPRGIRLHKGIEITYQSRREAEIRRWLCSHRWDMVVLSVHLVDYEDGWAIVSKRDSSDAYFAAHDQHQVAACYFEELLGAARSGLGDVLGHFDLFKRYGVAHYGPFRAEVFEAEVRAVLSAAIQHGVGLELNTSGLRQVPAEPYPGRTILRWYREMGGELLTIGSDAHHTAHLGAGCAEAAELARSVGFRAISVFQGRRPRWVDLV
ncbi:histidinol-phosphatase HisJ family protein [Chloroflexota bacterium]